MLHYVKYIRVKGTLILKEVIILKVVEPKSQYVVFMKPDDQRRTLFVSNKQT